MKDKAKFSKTTKLLTPKKIRQIVKEVKEVKEDLKEIEERKKVDYTKLRHVINI